MQTKKSAPDMTSKIQISFNQNQFENAAATLQDNVIRYRKYLDAIENITDSRDYKTLEQIEIFIKNKTTFSNIVLSAGLLDVLDSCRFIESNHNKINLKVLEIDGDIITTKKEVLSQAKEDATQYLKEQYLVDYNILLKACNELNLISNANASNFLTRSYDGRFSINLQMLQNSDRM